MFGFLKERKFKNFEILYEIEKRRMSDKFKELHRRIDCLNGIHRFVYHEPRNTVACDYCLKEKQLKEEAK